MLPHTADVIVEAWGPGLDDCLEESVAALLEAFADPSSAAVTGRIPVVLDPAPPEDLLVELLEEVVYLLDVLAVVPLGAVVDVREAGGVTGFFEVAPSAEVEVVGAAPKAVARSELEVARTASGWRARALVDV